MNLLDPRFWRDFSLPQRLAYFEQSYEELIAKGRQVCDQFGWGLSGYCPAPALVAAGGGVTPVLVFLFSMLLGMWAFSITDGTQMWEALTHINHFKSADLFLVDSTNAEVPGFTPPEKDIAAALENVFSLPLSDADRRR